LASASNDVWLLPKPQDGPQKQFYESDVDVVIYGGAAGGGKSFGLLLDFAKPQYIKTNLYRGVIFRKSYPELLAPLGLVDESYGLYSDLGGQFVAKPNPVWRWNAYGSKIEFRHLQHEKTKYQYKGAQFTRLGFDELAGDETQGFSEDQFFYMLSRNRSMCGIKPQTRATTNPDPDSWVARFIQWWWDPKDGYAIPERSGVVRYFLRINQVIYWADDKESLITEFRDELDEICEQSFGLVKPQDLIKSFTFICSSVFDNRLLLDKNPGYLAELNAQHNVEKERLLFGNWKIRFAAGLVFSGEWFKVIDYKDLPCEPLIKIRFWDLAATSREDAGKKTCSTAGCLMAMIGTNIYILDLLVFQRKAGEVFEAIKGTAIADGINTKIRYELEGGASSKILESDFAGELQSVNREFDIRAIKPDKSKLQRALPLATQAQQGHVFLIRGDWNGQFLSAVESFDGLFKATVNDIVDSATGAYEQVTNAQNAIIISSDTNFVGYLPQQSRQNRYI
jgi:predicted phage terminase large subunit-like protein